MNRDVYRARCFERAVEEDCESRITTTNSSPELYYFGNKYCISWNGVTGEYECDCPGFTHRGFCKHVAGLHRYFMVHGQIVPAPVRLEFAGA